MEVQNSLETLNEGSVDYKPVQSENPDGKTQEEVSVLSCLSESCAGGSELVRGVQLSECYGGEGVDVHKGFANGDERVELEGMGFEQKLADGLDSLDFKGVEGEKKLANVDDNNELEGVETEQKLVDGQGVIESEKMLANVGDNNDLEGVETEQKLVDGQGVIESEKKLANVDDYNGLVGVDVDSEFGNVDDTIDLEALGLENETIGFENLMEGANLEQETQQLGSIIPDTSKINGGGDVLVSKLGGEVNEPQVNTVEMVGLVDATETIDTSNVHSNDSPRKIEVSGDGISLFVEVFGPLNGTYQDEQMLANGGSGCMLSMNNDSPAEGNVGDNQEHDFAVGDLVWVKIKTPLWWPGMICDPAASKDAGKSDQRGSFFVKYFGNTNSAWCQPFQLKPFLDYFEQLSCQNKSRSFYGAIEKALGEIGRRVKQKMICSCFSKENQVAARSFPSKDDKDGGSVFSASQFEPSDFLKFIRLRALDLHSPGGIEFTVNESCLSAFYYSKGHKQLPLYKLRPTSSAKDEDGKLSSGDSVLKSCKSYPDDCKATEVKMSGSLESPKGSLISCSEAVNENAGGKSEKGFESRERKKSKYLSYPYVNSLSRKNSLGQGGDENDDHEEGSLGGGVRSPSSPSTVSTPIDNSSNKNSRRKSRKSVAVKDVCSTAEFITASSAEMLQELHLTALDCFFPSQSTSSVPIQEFYIRFRLFRNPEVEVQTDEYKEAVLGCQETYESSLGANTSDNGLASGENNLQVKEQPPPSVLPKKRGRKKREDSTSIDGSGLVDTVEGGPDTLKKGTVSRKRKKVVTAAVVHPEIGVLGGLPDLNGNNAGLSVENMQVVGPAPSQGKLEPKRRKRKKEELVSQISMPDASTSNTQFVQLPDASTSNTQFVQLPDASTSNTQFVQLPDASTSNTQFVQLLKSVQVAVPGSLESGPQPNNPLGVQGDPLPLNAEFLAGRPNANETHASMSSLPDNSQIMGQLASVKAEGKKRKRKEKASNIQNNSSALPDLNGHFAEPNLKAKDSAEVDAVTGQAKPKRRRRRTTKSAISIPGVGPGANTLLLDFQLGSSVPSKEYITATFSRFGELVESKTQFLNQSTAQVVFVKDTDAIEALQSLQSRNPFGPSLASYRVQHVSTSNNMQTPHSFLPTDVLMNPATLSGAVPSNGDGTDLVVIKQNLEAMTTMLEKAGDNISPEMRAKLESEVQGFLKKVSSMVGSSSS